MWTSILLRNRETHLRARISRAHDEVGQAISKGRPRANLELSIAREQRRAMEILSVVSYWIALTTSSIERSHDEEVYLAILELLRGTSLVNIHQRKP